MFKTVTIDLSDKFDLPTEGIEIVVNPVAWLPAAVAMKFQAYQDLDPSNTPAVMTALKGLYPDIIASWTVTRSMLGLDHTDETKDSIATLPDAENNIAEKIPLAIMMAIMEAASEDTGDIPLASEPDSSDELPEEGLPAESPQPAAEISETSASPVG